MTAVAAIMESPAQAPSIAASFFIRLLLSLLMAHERSLSGTGFEPTSEAAVMTTR